MPTSYGFTGQVGDAATGLDYYDARYYDPVSAQFTSADTVVPGGGFNLWGLSRYAYTRGNPTSRTDPTGHDDFGGGDFSGGDFSGGDFSGGDFSGGDFSGGDTVASGFDPNAPSIDRSEDPNFGMTPSDSGTGFDPNAPPIDRSEDPNFGNTPSDSGTGFDPNAPSIDRSEDPNFGMAPTDNSTGFDPSAPSIDRSEDPNFGMPTSDSGAQQQASTPPGDPRDPTSIGPWKDVYDRAMSLARDWNQIYTNGGTVDKAAASQQFNELRAEINRALDDPTTSTLGMGSLRQAAYNLYGAATMVGVASVGNIPADALGVLGGPAAPRRAGR